VTDFAEVATATADVGLGVVGAFHPNPGDGVPAGIATLLLLGPAGPGMWQVFSEGPEARDGAQNPLDRWSRRVIGGLAETCSAHPLFPFGGPPWHPFQRWAERGEGAVVSPVSMQASPVRGLWSSYRGALGFDRTIRLPEREERSPCLGCPAPCRSACPVEAIGPDGYDVPACVNHLTGNGKAPCHSGCLVRAACPAGRALALPLAQHAFHMAAFLRARG